LTTRYYGYTIGIKTKEGRGSAHYELIWEIPAQWTNSVWQPLGYEEGYVGQLIFINKKVETLVDEILSKSDVPPIVILQGDHGIRWGKGRGIDILNAYYLPGKDNQLLYESITPVNSFRIIFNLYFGTNYDLLEDEGY